MSLKGLFTIGASRSGTGRAMPRFPGDQPQRFEIGDPEPVPERYRLSARECLVYRRFRVSRPIEKTEPRAGCSDPYGKISRGLTDAGPGISRTSSRRELRTQLSDSAIK